MISRTTAYETYLKTWSAIGAAERSELLALCVTEGVAFLNEVKSRKGIIDIAEHLSAFQSQMPGASFRLNNMVGWGSYALAEWQLVNADNGLGFSGYDTLTFDESGLISNIVMVVNIEQQKIIWRRRDPVSLEPTA